MPLGKKSLQRLATCHPVLREFVQRLSDLSEASGAGEITVLCGFRNKADQSAAVARGTSQTPWPKSRHNSNPSEAVDVAPYPMDWQDLAAFKRLGRLAVQVAQEMGLPAGAIEWGGDWRKFKDYPHYQLSRAYVESLAAPTLPAPAKVPEALEPKCRVAVEAPGGRVFTVTLEQLVAFMAGGHGL